MGEYLVRGQKTYSQARGEHILRMLVEKLETDLYTAYVYAINKAADKHTNIVDYLQYVEMLDKAYGIMVDDGYE